MRISHKMLMTAVIPSLCLSLMACSKVDNYLLGKDNTPVPSTLEPIASNISIQEKWSSTMGTGKNTVFLKLKPVIIHDKVYTADASGLVSAVNKQDGKVLWSQQFKSNIVSGPSVGEGYILVGTGSAKILALDQNNGKKIWQANLSGDALAKPLIVQNKALIKTIDGNLYAFDLKTGKKLWLSEHGAPSLILKASSSPVVANNKIALVGYSDGKMDAVNIANGQILWQKSIAFSNGVSDVERLVDVDADPIVQGDKVLLATYQGYIGVLSMASGEFIWRKPASTFSNIITQGNAVYMTDSDDVVWSINKDNGNVNWKQDKLKARGLTEPSLVGNRLVIGDKTGIVHLLSTQNGELMGRKQLGGAIHTSPSVSGNSIYVMSNNGKLTRLSVG